MGQISDVGKALNMKRHNAGVFSCSEDPLSCVFEQGRGCVVVKSIPPLENRDGGWELGMGTPPPCVSSEEGVTLARRDTYAGVFLCLACVCG